MLITESSFYKKLPPALRPPVFCPYCGSNLVIQDAWPFCPDFNCPHRIWGRLQKFTEVLDAKNIGEGALWGLVELGLIKTPADLFDITVSQFCQVDRKGPRHYDKFRRGLELIRKMSPAQFFASLDIEGLGTWNNICAVPGLQTIDQILDTILSGQSHKLAEAIRVSPEKAKSIGKEIKSRIIEIEKLRSQITYRETTTTMVGKVICITGTLTSGPRPKIEQMIRDAGGQVVSSCSSRTSYLVTNDPNSGSSKNRDAHRHKVPIISEDQLLTMLKG